MAKRRVVVTGIGTVNALGNTVNEFWNNSKNGCIGIGTISSFDIQATTKEVQNGRNYFSRG